MLKILRHKTMSNNHNKDFTILSHRLTVIGGQKTKLWNNKMKLWCHVGICAPNNSPFHLIPRSFTAFQTILLKKNLQGFTVKRLQLLENLNHLFSICSWTFLVLSDQLMVVQCNVLFNDSSQPLWSPSWYLYHCEIFLPTFCQYLVKLVAYSHCFQLMFTLGFYFLSSLVKISVRSCPVMGRACKRASTSIRFKKKKIFHVTHYTNHLI